MSIRMVVRAIDYEGNATPEDGWSVISAPDATKFADVYRRLQPVPRAETHKKWEVQYFIEKRECDVAEILLMALNQLENDLDDYRRGL